VTDEPLRVRAPVVRIVDHGASTTVIGASATLRFDGDSAALLRAVLEICTRPVRRGELMAALAARAGEPEGSAAAGGGLTSEPTSEPTGGATSGPTSEPTGGAMSGPTSDPTSGPTSGATSGPTSEATGAPTSELTGAPTSEPTSGPTSGPAGRAIDDLVELLVREGVLVAARAPAPPRPAARSPRVVVGISGAVAAVDTPALIRGLQAAGCEVRVALTRHARKLVSPIALEALTHQPVWHSLWPRDPQVPVPHIQLAEWAELVLVCPASATTLSRIATGDCSDLVAAIVAATRAPVVIVPSMNDAMYESPAIQANLAVLRDHGRHVVHPALGVELAHPPHARPALLGPAPPASAVVDIVRHVLDVASRGR
jgi:3-polyprenyl-4-hydroxybenzoate decarboxylase